MKKRPLEDRFFEKVDKTNSKIHWGGTCCHEWQGHVMPNGYGQISRNLRPAYAHRVSWELSKGPIPNGSYVLHRCDNRRCVNVDHLFLGTFSENMADMVAKRRQAHGERNGHAKLTEDRVRLIRSTSASPHALAAKFGVTKGTIEEVRNGGTWRLVDKI